MGPLGEAAADLVLGSRCAGCARAGPPLCRGCAHSLRPVVGPAWPLPAPLALTNPVPVTPYAAGNYDGPLRSTLLEFKERGRFALLPVLAGLLDAAVLAAAARRGPVLLVPMPSRRSASRARGYDAVNLIATRAARTLRAGGHDVLVGRVLRHRGTARDQAGLSAQERARNLAGALRAVHRPASTRTVVLVDDVITTGASMAEAVRALRRIGTQPHAIAVVAATRRRPAPRQHW